MRYTAHRAWLAAAVTACVAVAVALVVDRWYAAHLRDDARDATRMMMAPYATALEGAVDRRVALLIGLRSFADSRPTRRSLDEEFPVFAQGTLVSTSGVVALQFVEAGRIGMTWPIKGNERALGYDLYADPRPGLAADVRRAIASGEVTVTGPIALVQGGNGLLVRQRIAARSGFPDLAAVILDVPTLVAEAGIVGGAPNIRLEVRDRSGAWFGGDSAGAVQDAERLRVRVPDGDWTLLGMPAGGWDAAIANPLRSARRTAAALVLVAGLLGFMLGGREDRLRRNAARSDTRLGIALRAGQMGVLECEIATRRVSVSDGAAAVLGAAPGARLDTLAALLDRVHPDDRAQVEQQFDALRLGRRDELQVEFRVRRADGITRWVLMIGEVERDDADRPARLLGVLSDATERRAMEERVRESQRLESVATLAAGVAHDFNNMLSAIVGFTELASLRARQLADAAQREAILGSHTQVLQTTERAVTLTGQLLAFSRKQDTAPTLVDVSAALRGLEPMLRQLLGRERGFVAVLADDLPPVVCDAGQLTQVMLNLIVNARDAMPDGGTVTVRTAAVTALPAPLDAGSDKAPWVHIEVRDTGTGIPAEVVSRIFEPYYTTKPEGRGTGLGLAVVYGAVTGAGGVVTVESTEGVGTTFHVYLPAERGARAVSARD